MSDDDRASSAASASPPGGDDPGLSGSWLFHVALIAGVLPVAGLPIVALATIAAWRRAASGARERRWARRITGVLVVDLVASAVVIATTAGLLPMPSATDAAGGPRIGVTLDASYAGEGVRVERVLDGSPAARAGIAEGDVIVSAAGRPVGSLDALRDALRASGGGAGGGSASGGEVALEVRRGEETRTVQVAPSSGPLAPDERCPDVDVEALVPERGVIVSYAIVLAGSLALAWLARRRRVPGVARTILPFLAIPPLAALGSLAVALIACAAGGAAMVVELALVGSELVLVSAAAGAVWLASRGWEGATPTPGGEPPLPVAEVYGLGLLYVATWVPRVLFLALPLFALARSMGGGGGSEELEQVLGGDRAPLALAMTFVAAAVLAPIGEELLFRGLLLPWLARVVAPWTAIVVSALLFGALHEAHGVARVGPMAIGVVLGWARLRSGTLRAPIAIHATVNATALILGWLAS